MFQIDYSILIMWFLITFGGIIVLTLMYRLILKSMPRRLEIELNNVSEKPSSKYMFISADQERSQKLLKESREYFEKGDFSNAMERAYEAIKDVLVQLLQFFNLEKVDMNIDAILNDLTENGVILGRKEDIIELSKVCRKINDKGAFRKEEAFYSLHLISIFVERTKEARVSK